MKWTVTVPAPVVPAHDRADVAAVVGFDAVAGGEMGSGVLGAGDIVGDDAVGSRWFRQAGGMPLLALVPVPGRYLSFTEREEITILHDPAARVRFIGRRHTRRADRPGPSGGARSRSRTGSGSTSPVMSPCASRMRPSIRPSRCRACGALKRELVACLRTGRARRVPRARTRGRGNQFVTLEILISERPAEGEGRAWASWHSWSPSWTSSPGLRP